jgi:mannosyltransferase OCH1-like enzyme
MDWNASSAVFSGNYSHMYDYYQLILDTIEEDDFYILWMVARCHREIGESYIEYKKYYDNVCTKFPEYTEPLYELALNTPDRKEACELFRKCSLIPKPKIIDHFIDIEIYEWKALEKYYIESFYLDDFSNLYDIEQELYKRKVPQHVLDNSVFTNNNSLDHLSYAKFRIELLDFSLEIKNDPPKNIFHFIWVKGCRQFSMIHYITIKTIIETQKDYVIYVYNDIEPQENIWWEKAKNFIKIKQITMPKIINSQYIPYPQHIADLMRICIIYEIGGIYVDSDLLLLKSIDDLCDVDKVVMVQESERKLWNGLIIAPAKHSFFKRWIREYEIGYGESADCWWAGLSVTTPMRLHNQIPGELIVLEKELFLPFYLYDYTIYKGIWTEGLYEESYGLHLWETESEKAGVLPKDENYFKDYPGTPFSKLFSKYI